MFGRTESEIAWGVVADEARRPIVAPDVEFRRPMLDVPPLVLYTKPGCHRCEQARAALDALLAARAAAGLVVPPVEERDITTDDAWQRAFFDRIPVVELADRRLDELTSPARLRRLLADVLDAGG